MERLIQELDRPTKQVYIQAEIALHALDGVNNVNLLSTKSDHYGQPGIGH